MKIVFGKIRKVLSCLLAGASLTMMLINSGYAQNLGKNIVTNGDFGKLPEGADINSYRQQRSISQDLENEEEGFGDISYLSGGKFSKDGGNNYIIAARVNSFFSNDWWGDYRDESENGLMLVVEAKYNNSTFFYSRRFVGLYAEMWYKASARAMNPIAKNYINLGVPWKPEVELWCNQERKSSTGSLGWGDGSWHTVTSDLKVAAEEIVELRFLVKRTGGGGAINVGCDVALDNIEFRPYLLSPSSIELNGCQVTSTGSVTLISSVAGGPSGNETKYGRWMKRAKGGSWEWIGGTESIQSADYNLTQDTATFRLSDYRILYSFSKSLLNSFAIPPSELSDNYAFSEIFAGRELPALALGTPAVICKIGTLQNTGTVNVTYPSGISELTWQIDNGPTTTTVCPGGQNSVDVDFDFGEADQIFQIVSYKVPDFCKDALSISGLTFSLKPLYIPNTVSDDINAPDVVLCSGEAGILEAEPARKTIQNPVFYWYDNVQLTGQPLGTTASILLSPSLANGTHQYYVTIKAVNRCLSVPEAAKEVSVQVNPFAVADELKVTGELTVCEKESLALTAEVMDGASVDYPQFEWYSSADWASGTLLGAGAIYTGDTFEAGEHRLYVRMKGDNRCFNLAGAGKEVTVQVTPRAEAGDITIDGDSRICLADVLNLTAKVTDGKNMTHPVFKWYRDASLTEPETQGVTGEGTNFSLSGLKAGQHAWYVTLMSDEVCENWPGAALQVPVAVLDSFVLPVIPSDTVRIFKDDDAVLSLDIQTDSELQYEWYASSDLSGTVLGNDKSVTIPGLGEGVHLFYVRIKDENTCWSRPVEMPVRVYPPTNIWVDNISVCQGNGADLMVKTTLTDLTIVWSDKEDISNVLGTERNLSLPANLTVGEHTYYVQVTDNSNGLTIKQAVKATVVPRAAITGNAFEGRTVLCVGNELRIPFATLTDAVQYKIRLKSSTLEGFTFPEYAASVTPEMLAAGELPVATSDFVIPAEMNGFDFIFSVELIGRSVNTGGKIETCSAVRDFAFAVQKLPEITIDEPGIVCSGGTLTLASFIELNGNDLLGTEWRVEKESGEEILSSDRILNLTDLTKEWNGRQVWLRVQTGCGWTESGRVTLRVYDNDFNTISYSGGDIYPGMMVKVEGNAIPLNGLLYSWEYKTFYGEWVALEGKNTAFIYTPVEIAGSFRRIVAAGECGGISNEVEIKIADYTDTTGTDEGLGRYVYQETFGYVSQFEWLKENGDKRDISTYRKFDHTRGINTSSYSVHNYEMKPESEWEESVNDINRLPEQNPLLFYSGDWEFQQTATNAISEPWTKYKNNPAYVWCTDNMLIYNSRTGYVENGTYCSGNLTVTQPARWFNINGSWKMGYWFRYFYTGKSPGLGDGKYALSPCPYQLDPGALIKYSKSADHTADPAGETGLMLMLNSKDNGVAYSNTVTGLTGGMWYRLEAHVANPETGGLNNQPNIKIEVTGTGITGENGRSNPSVTSGSLGRNDALSWTRCTLNFFVPEGVNQVKFSISNTNGSGAGNVFVLDDISIRELLIKSWTLSEDFCVQPGDVKFTLSNEVVFPDYAVAYSRLMQKEKNGDRWEWAGEISDSMKLVTTSEWAVSHDFRVVEAFSASLLEKIDPNNLAATNELGYYALTEKYEVPEFCLILNDYKVDYTAVTDSVKIIPDFAGVPQGANICSRFLFRRFGSDVWEWYGKAGINCISWIDMLEGDYRVVYGFSDKLLNRLSAADIQTRAAYYVASDIISGVKPVLTITEKIENGQVTLKPEIEGLPMGALPGGCWMKRDKGTEDWAWLPMSLNLSHSASLFVYSEEEYRFVYTQSQALIDTLAVGNVKEGGHGYLVSQIFTGKEYKIGEVTADFCAVPGHVVQNLAFSSAYPENVEIHGRWMQKEKNSEAWSWMSNVVYGLPDFEVSMSDYLAHDYQLVLSWSRDSLRNWQAGKLPVENNFYRIGDPTKELPVCIRIDTIRVASVDKGKFELLPEVSCDQNTAVLYGRWMKTLAGMDNWEWIDGDAAAGMVKLAVTTDELREYDYRYMTAFEGALPTDAGRTAASPYFVGETFEHVNVLQPTLVEKQMLCVPGRDSNRIDLSFACPGEITTLTYRVGTGEVTTDSVNNVDKISFAVATDETFCLLYYAQQGFCDRILLGDTIDITYKPRPVIANMTDVFTCLNNEVRIAPKVSGIGELHKNWYKGEETLPFSSQDTLQMRMEQPDTLEIRLAVDGDEVCPMEERVHVIAADYPEMIRDSEVNSICVGNPFRLNYRSTSAEQYRVILKESSMPGFSLYSGVTDIREKENGTLEIYSGQTPLYATEFMAGHEFTFRVQIYRYVEYSGVTYRCNSEFDVVFKVSPKPVSRYVGDIYACMNESLNLNPVVEQNGIQVIEYIWRLWDGDSVKTDKILTRSQTDAGLNFVVGEEWQGKRLQLVVVCSCGEVVVQDIPLNIFDNRQNIVSAPVQIVLTDENVNITGSEMNTEGIGYQWEYKSGEGDWKELTGETAISLNIRVPETTTVYRRRIISDVYACEGRASDSVTLNVYNNKLENVISLDVPADTLVNTGSVVHVGAETKMRDGIEFVWQKNDAGMWVDAESEESGSFRFSVEDMTMIRRKAIVGDKQLYSNIVLVNVYDAGKNQIIAPVSVILPGESATIIGNYFGLPGVKYGWWMNPESEGVWTRIYGADSWNLETGLSESALYKRYVYLPTGDTLKSNELRITVFDNERDNRISCPELNVCKSETIQITGKEIGGTETVYRWEYSFDGGNYWEVIDRQNVASLNYTAEKSMLLRRFVVVGNLDDSFSNVLDINVIHGTEDNVIAFAGIVISGRPAEIKGNEVKNAVYVWERSGDGENNWQVITGADGNSLLLDAAQTTETSYFRRRLKFQEGGCEVVSGALKMVIMDNRRNTISGPEKPVCQWGEFDLTGEDLGDVGAKYQWYCNRGNQWVACEYAFEKDLKIYEGIGENADFRRDVIVDGQLYESNVVKVVVRNGELVDNTVEQPEAVCPGVEVVLKGSDLSSGWEGYIKDYYWEKSATAAGDSWERVDSANTSNLALKDVEDPEWYCRIVTTYCGNALRSEPVLLEVKERLPLTLRNNVTFGEMKVKEAVRVSVDEDFYRSYEFKIDGEMKTSDGNEYLFYGWIPKREYQVVVNALTSQGCMQTDTMRLRTSDVDLPNVLTPNDDGYNDRLLADYNLKVYNRWGNLLFEGTEGWDGKYKSRLVTPGTYFYVVRIQQPGGNVAEYKRSVTVKK